ncbi:MAG: hypothetical protein HQL32_04355 [Planctomycetes bacterium]|nr:hypothetical protein [Planctomycetota bacterium]
MEVAQINPISMMVPVLFLVFAIFGVVLWVVPVALGISATKKKGISPHWMWLGLHPISAWIAFFVIRFGLDPRKKCPMCKESIKEAAVICHYCRHEFPEKRIA